MRVRGKGAIITGAEGRSPPLPYIEVDDNEAKALIGLGVAERVEPDEAVAAETPEPEVVETPEPEPVEVDEVVQEPDEESPAATDPTEADPDEARKADLNEAFELLGDEDFVKTGARAGRPKIASLEAATGFSDLTVDEVDALWSARGGAE